MVAIFLYPLIPATILGTLVWLNGKKKGYTSKVQLILGIMIFYAGFFLLWKYIAA